MYTDLATVAGPNVSGMKLQTSRDWVARYFGNGSRIDTFPHAEIHFFFLRKTQRVPSEHGFRDTIQYPFGQLNSPWHTLQGYC